MPTFARPLTPQSARAAASTPMLSPAMTALSLVTLSCAALFLFARPDNAQNLPTSKGGVAAHKQAAAVKPADSDVAGDASASADHQDISFYTSNVRDGMFSAPVPPPAKVVTATPIKKPFKQIIVQTAPINPFAGWTYTGTVHMGDITVALLENRDNPQNPQGVYVKAGDTFPGMNHSTIKSVTDREVTIDGGAKTTPTMLAKSDDIIVNQLDRDAPGKNPEKQMQAQNGQQQPNGQQAQAAAAATPQITVMSPNGPLSGSQAQRYQNRLNRGFGGGQGGQQGGGGQGGFGGGGTGGGGGGRRGGGGGRGNFGG